MNHDELKRIDYLGLALDLEARATVTSSKTTQRAMERAAITLRLLNKYFHAVTHNALAQADAACGVSPGAMGSASAGLEKK